MRNKITSEMLHKAQQMRKQNPEESWKEFADELNVYFNVDFTESAWRKPLQNATKVLESSLPEEVIFAREKRIRQAIEEKKVIAKEADTKLLDYLSRESLLTLVESFAKPIPKQKSFLDKKTKIKSSGVPVYIISDMQEDGSNFSEKVFKEVERKIIDDILMFNYQEIYILENGDGIDGCLRLSDLRNNSQGYVGQLLNYQKALSELLLTLSCCTKVNFSIVNSNHTELRPFGTPRGAIKSEDVTILILEYLRGVLKKQDIVFLNGTDLNYNIIDIAGFKVFQHHGDMSYSSSSKPLETFNKIRDQYGSNIDIAILAHYHHTTLLKHISARPITGGDRQILFVPALDPRTTKQNEINLGLSSMPCWTKIVISEGEGISLVEFNRLKGE